MPLSFAEALKRDIDRMEFVKEQDKVKKKKKKERSPATDVSLKKGADLKLVLRSAALNLRQVQMLYRKDTTKEVKNYRVAPYSYRFRKSQNVRKRMLFAYDMDDKHIKGFVVRNILKVKILDKKFRPKWPVEIG